jgi:hypothetical protein
LTRRKNHDGKSGYDLGAGLTGCDGEIDERPPEEVFFASPSHPFSGKTEVTRELDRKSIGLGRSAPRSGGSGPCILKVEQHFHFAILDNYLYFIFDLFFFITIFYNVVTA